MFRSCPSHFFDDLCMCCSCLFACCSYVCCCVSLFCNKHFDAVLLTFSVLLFWLLGFEFACALLLHLIVVAV